MRLLLAALACWRLTSLLVYEDGPRDIFSRFRAWLWMTDLLDCFWCTSLWVAAPLATLAWWPDGRPMLLGWLAVSTGAILLDNLIPTEEGTNG